MIDLIRALSAIMEKNLLTTIEPPKNGRILATAGKVPTRNVMST